MTTKFESQFLQPELRNLVDRVVPSTLESTKLKLVEAMKAGDKFSDPNHYGTIESATTPARLQSVYYNYILASENNKVI